LGPGGEGKKTNRKKPGPWEKKKLFCPGILSLSWGIFFFVGIRSRCKAARRGRLGPEHAGGIAMAQVPRTGRIMLEIPLALEVSRLALGPDERGPPPLTRTRAQWAVAAGSFELCSGQAVRAARGCPAR